jgi:hypothetical protein
VAIGGGGVTFGKQRPKIRERLQQMATIARQFHSVQVENLASNASYEG